MCEIGTPVKCGSFVRLQHVATGKNLHSHNFRAPLSGNQEVSGFGDPSSGDTGDSWEVVCAAKAEFWERGKPIHLKHMDTGKWLSTSDQYAFTQQNCGGGCPIMGQFEVSASSKRDAKSIWYTGQGIYFPPQSQGGKKSDEDIDDEL
jgi:dolichyl-phosphate-mannose--protein O-mannosyl transferase